MESKSLTNKNELHGIHHAMTMRNEGMSMVVQKPELKMEKIHEIEEGGSSKSGSFDPDAETPQYDLNQKLNFKNKIS